MEYENNYQMQNSIIPNHKIDASPLEFLQYYLLHKHSILFILS